MNIVYYNLINEYFKSVDRGSKICILSKRAGTGVSQCKILFEEGSGGDI